MEELAWLVHCNHMCVLARWRCRLSVLEWMYVSVAAAWSVGQPSTWAGEACCCCFCMEQCVYVRSMLRAPVGVCVWICDADEVAAALRLFGVARLYY